MVCLCDMQEIVLNIDIAPTLVDLAGIKDGSEAVTDGQSFKSLVLSNVSNWRTEFLVEHEGEYRQVIKGCPHLNNQNVAVSVLWSCFS